MLSHDLRAGATVKRPQHYARGAMLLMRIFVSRIRDRCSLVHFCSEPTGSGSGGATAASLVALGLMLVSLAGPAGADARTCDRVAAPNWRLSNPKTLVHKLRPGQTGCLHGGVYRTRQVIIRKPGITVRSYPGERALWSGRIVLGAYHVTLQNLDLDGSPGPPCRGFGCYPGEDSLPSPTINGAGARLLGNDIINSRGICVAVRKYYGLTPNRFRIEGNRIHDCRPA